MKFGFFWKSSLTFSHLGSLLESFLKSTHHVEGGLWVLITSTIKKLGETFDGIGELCESTWHTGEHLSHLEGLGQESLDLSGSGDSESIFLRQLIHTKNGDNILE